MKIHKIEDERLSIVRLSLNEAIVNLYHGYEKAAKDLVQKAISNLVTEGPTHEDRWELVWLPYSLAHNERPDFIPEAVWPMVRIKTLWAYDSTVITHYCSAEKLRLMYPLGVQAVTVEHGNAECDAVMESEILTAKWAEFWEQLEEYANEVVFWEKPDTFSKSYVDKHLVVPSRWLREDVQEGWREYQEDNDGVDFDDDDTRTKHIVEFLSQWFREAGPWS